jgi:hypothetical protein
MKYGEKNTVIANESEIGEFRTGCPVFTDLWSYVLYRVTIDNIIQGPIYHHHKPVLLTLHDALQPYF